MAGDEDRPAVPVPTDLARRALVRLGDLRLPLPGSAWSDAVARLPGLHPLAHSQRPEPASLTALGAAGRHHAGPSPRRLPGRGDDRTR
ncbi:hypothetical protein FRACA_420017 [Frankia canadensis]|uniref:Uncharacterized protein n=1 Tax=Frankia canadensis TaxID=1836972 RepID=A0A2I2KX38_9ACTN|nr:hypothetical protein FRACA_420017 [Frankia canadensis]SOU57506.1 hypothetical protein FRACA_420017 [Frankia canadensis]